MFMSFERNGDLMLTMKVKTLEPLTLEEMFELTGKDALITLDGYKCRIMNASPGQIIDVNRVVWSSKTKLQFGLREVKGKPYKFLAFRCEVIE